MKNYKIDYTTPEGERRRTAVAFDYGSAEYWEKELAKSGNTDMKVVMVKPGE